MAHVITLPREFFGRATARRLAAGINDTDIALDAGSVLRHNTPALDELVKQLLNADVERVVTVNASPTFQRALQVIHRARTRPERTFLLTFRDVPAEALLRAV
ncbi:hypothetical protein [Microbacterium sp.]|jgi:protoheme ferro-lyase|uniref:hypothetical protein n=1 Tax=Microbacterium sp. TaxID=51671 RepID=UPI002C080D53|nr:hypothetical protein [Microbacterium sp.]HET6302791.1 hypothetical protein [Microbacterium sp.]HWL76528.1 hypothetical protein [Microbacterium sp.]